MSLTLRIFVEEFEFVTISFAFCILRSKRLFFSPFNGVCVCGGGGFYEKFHAPIYSCPICTVKRKRATTLLKVSAMNEN